MGKRPKENIVTVEIHMNKIFKMDPVFYGSKTEILTELSQVNIHSSSD